MSKLWNHSIVASGVDVSEVAVDRARRVRSAAADQCTGLCFQQASATELPFATGAFDAVLATDVLEHIMPDDVPSAVAELSRVASRLLVLSVSCTVEADRTHMRLLKRQGYTTPGARLHASILEPASWVSAFAKQGFALRLMERGEMFIMERRGRRGGHAGGHCAKVLRHAMQNATWAALRRCGALNCKRHRFKRLPTWYHRTLYSCSYSGDC